MADLMFWRATNRKELSQVSNVIVIKVRLYEASFVGGCIVLMQLESKQK